MFGIKASTLYVILVHIALVVISLLYIDADRVLRSHVSLFHNQTLAFQLRIDKNLASQNVIFIGDSHIQGLAVQEIVSGAANFGIGADTTDGVLHRLPMYESIKNASAIILAIGFNDLRKKSNEEILVNYAEIISHIPERVPVYISLLLPIDEAVVEIPHVTNARIDDLNEELRFFFKSCSRCQIVDVGQFLKNDDGQLNYRFHNGDGIHLNQHGYSVYIDVVKQKLARN